MSLESFWIWRVIRQPCSEIYAQEKWELRGGPRTSELCPGALQTSGSYYIAPSNVAWPFRTSSWNSHKWYIRPKIRPSVRIGYLPPPLTNTGLLGFEYHVNNFGQKRRFKTLCRGRDQGLDSNYMKYRARITSLVIELDSWVGWSLEWSVIDCLTCYPESWVIIVPDQYQVRPHTFSN